MSASSRPGLEWKFHGANSMDEAEEDVSDDMWSPASSAAQSQRQHHADPFDDAELRALLDQVLHQDQHALSRLYALMIGRVYGLALRITRDTGLAEEVAEDTFWQVWRQAPRYDAARGTVAAWVQTIARSRALDALRRQHPLQLEADMDLLAETSDLADHEASNPQDLLAATQRDSHLHQALVSLEPLPRQLVALAFFRGLTHEEISSHTALPLGTVKSHLRRAIVRLRQTLEPEPERRGAPS